jgi:hypothetical protein
VNRIVVVRTEKRPRDERMARFVLRVETMRKTARADVFPRKDAGALTPKRR